MQPDAQIFGRLADTLSGSWRLKARIEQLPPDGDWSTWLILAGRGFGKTRSGAEWVQEQAATGSARRIALVGATAADVRDVMIEGESGIVNIAPAHMRPDYEPSKRRLTWPNGAVARAFSADEPDRLRGPEHDAAWADELASWRFPEAFDMLKFGLRLGRARLIVTTTPKPTRLIRELLGRDDGSVVITRGSTFDNAANLAPTALAELRARYEGTRLGRQELSGEFLDDVPGALWQREWIDRDRVDNAPPMKRVVVAIDPSVSNTERSDLTGIVVVGLGHDDHVYVLADLSLRAGPNEWAQKAVAAYHTFRADRIVAEVNNGGDLVRGTLITVDPMVPFKAVHATRGKAVRAEPVSSLYEQSKAHHVGSFLDLEDQLCAFTSDFDRGRAGYSPDRLDALVWGVTELAVRPSAPVAASAFYRVVKYGPGLDAGRDIHGITYKPAPPFPRVRLRNVDTGEVGIFDPMDAREVLATPGSIYEVLKGDRP